MALSVALTAGLQGRKHYSPFTYKKTEAQRGRGFSHGTYSMISPNPGFLHCPGPRCSCSVTPGPQFDQKLCGTSDRELLFHPFRKSWVLPAQEGSLHLTLQQPVGQQSFPVEVLSPDMSLQQWRLQTPWSRASIIKIDNLTLVLNETSIANERQ